MNENGMVGKTEEFMPSLLLCLSVAQDPFSCSKCRPATSSEAPQLRSHSAGSSSACIAWHGQRAYQSKTFVKLFLRATREGSPLRAEQMQNLSNDCAGQHSCGK